MMKIITALVFTVAALFPAHSKSQPFSEPLPVPPLLEGELTASGTRHFALTAQEGSVSFIEGKSTPTYGYNGDYLGPTIRVKKGERVSFDINNTLGEVTTVHWHGLHVPAEMDGGPRQRIEAGTVWRPQFPIVQQAATLWYHPHAIGKTGEHVYRGLAGLFIIDDEVSDSLSIPRTYGVDDIPLIVQDRRFNRDGSFAYIRGMPDVMHGVVGNILLVNGRSQPYQEVERGLVRLRVLNGSNSSIYSFHMEDSASFSHIASDGGFLESHVVMTSIILSPGERAELIVDFSRYKTGDSILMNVDEINGQEFEALEFRITEGGDSGSGMTLPAELRRVERIDPSLARRTRRFEMTAMGMMGMTEQLSINGKTMDLDRIDERVKLGDVEIWEIHNRTMGMMNLSHSFHIHDVQFQILERAGEPPLPGEAGWKDTVAVWPGTTVRVIAAFEDYTGIYMYHCHLLEHEDAGMMGQFEVVE